MDFGKLNFAVGFNRTSAFPLDANSYFESYTDAVAAAAGAATVGSSDSAYYIGQLIIVNESGKFGLYQIGADKTLVKFGQASSADALAVDVATLKSYFTNGIANKASADASGNVITSTYATKTEMNTAIQSAVAGAVQYLGIANSKDDLVSPNSTGDFYRAGTAFDLPAASSQTGAVVKVHVGDLIICEDKETPKWSIIHGEEIGVASIAADGSGVSITGTATNPKVKLNAATTTTLGGVIVGEGLTVDTNGKLNSTAATQITTAINALDVEAVNLGAGETVKSISETNGKIAVTTQSISINQSQVDGLSKALDVKANSVDLENKLDRSALTVSATAGVTLGSVTYKYELPQANANTLGGVKSTKTGTTADRNYNVEVNSDGTMKVNVPWTDTKYTLPTASATVLGGVKIGSGITITDGVISLTDKIKYDGYKTNKLDKSALTVSATAGVTLNGTTYKYTLPEATDEVLGGIKFNKRYVLDGEFTPAADSVVQASSQMYPLVCDQSGIPFVYVPWTDTKYTLTQANANNLGGIKIGYTTSDRNFAVQLDPNGKAYVTVPASAEYQLPTAAENTLGGIKAKQSDGADTIQYIMNKKAYGVMVDASGHAWVGIPDTISADKITQGTNTLIINGGGANW